MNVYNKQTKTLTTAIYATTPSGNKRFNVDGKFYTDRQFGKLFEEVGEDDTLKFKVHTDFFLKELTTNLHNSHDGKGGGGILFQPLNIFRSLLVRVGDEAARINDHRLNKVMILLGIYSIACPDDPAYDAEKVRRILANDLSVYE